MNVREEKPSKGEGIISRFLREIREALPNKLTFEQRPAKLREGDLQISKRRL